MCVYGDGEGVFVGVIFKHWREWGGIQECYFFDNSFVHYSSNTVDHASQARSNKIKPWMGDCNMLQK